MSIYTHIHKKIYLAYVFNLQHIKYDINVVIGDFATLL